MNKKGFTLIELVVALALFMLVIDIVVSMFVMIVHHQKNVLHQQQALNEISFLQEIMSSQLKNAQLSKNTACLTGASDVYALTHLNVSSGFYEGIKFLTAEGTCQEFFLDNGTVKKRENNQLAQSILSGNTIITSVAFILNGNPRLQVVRFSDVLQPRVTFAISIQSPESANARIFQTTISWRNPHD